MNYVLIGKLVNTHALKGEVRIISDFEFKSRVFIPGFNLYIGKKYEKLTIKTYRHHKNYDMCTFEGYDDISQVLDFKGSYVYINREDLILKENEYLDTDLISFDAIFNNEKIGVVESIINNNGYKLFLVSGKYIPKSDNFICNVDMVNKKISFKNLEGII